MSSSDLTALFVVQPYGPYHYLTARLNTALIIASWSFFAGRLFVRRKFLKHTSTDDWLMLIALLLFTVYAGITIEFMYILTSGRVLTQSTRFTNFYAIAVAFSFWSNITLKISLCFFFLRLLTQKYAKWIIIGATIISTAANLTGCLVFLINCGGPAESITYLFTDTCAKSPHIDGKEFARVAVWFPVYTNVAVDVIFSLIPIPMLLQTTLDRKQKLTVCIYLALSTCGSICAIGKIFMTSGRASIAVYVSLATGYSSFNTGELAAYIIGGSIAAYRPMLMAIGRRINDSIRTAERTGASVTHGSVSFVEYGRARRSVVSRSTMLDDTAVVVAGGSVVPSPKHGSKIGYTEDDTIEHSDASHEFDFGLQDAKFDFGEQSSVDVHSVAGDGSRHTRNWSDGRETIDTTDLKEEAV